MPVSDSTKLALPTLRIALFQGILFQEYMQLIDV